MGVRCGKDTRDNDLSYRYRPAALWFETSALPIGNGWAGAARNHRPKGPPWPARYSRHYAGAGCHAASPRDADGPPAGQTTTGNDTATMTSSSSYSPSAHRWSVAINASFETGGLRFGKCAADLRRPPAAGLIA